MQGLHTNRIAALFPPPEFLAMPAAGIDISDTSIKYLDATYSSAGLVPRVFDVVRLPNGVVVEGVVQDRAQLSDALRELKERHGRNFANVSLPEEHAYLYTIEVPTAHKQKDILQVVEFSLSEHAPIPSDNAVFNYDVIRQQGNVTEVSVTVFPKDVIETYKQAFEDSGFQVKSFELEDQSIARSIIPVGSKSVSMVIDFGRTRTGITIALGQIPIFSTTVKIGGNVLTEAIIAQFNVSEEEADEIKRTQGLEDCEDEALKKTLTDTTNALIDEIRRHYRYWDTRRDEEGNRIAGIERIFLCGGAVGLKGLPEQVSAVLQVPVQVGNVWGNMFDLNTHIPKISRTISWQAAASAGLLLRDVM
ncbi:pilus assembly protein PilM [Candidatus Kaiserbacteria bacterium]|nr:MAG: pilus assembly protein PilM [Candidatus Kaiserbacteria bacterium]